MTKEEYIEKYGEEKYNKKIIQSREWKKVNKNYNKDYYLSHKKYYSSKAKEYRLTLDGKSNCIYASSRSADKQKGFPEPNITQEQIKEIIQQPCYWCGQTDWTKNGIDRIDNSKGHDFDNVVCSCWECNHKRGIEYLFKPVLQFTLEGEFVKEWTNAWEASRQTGIQHTSIIKCLKGKRNKAGEHEWKYKEASD